ncbi:MAG: hypothetical protein HN590_11140, partial [Calditrichaeota bacterium]|nr:hypothetical protein [Calditrichota bacterium]
VMAMALGRFSLFNWGTVSYEDPDKKSIILVNPVRTEIYIRRDSTASDDSTLWPYTDRVVTWDAADTLWYSPGLKAPIGKDEKWYDEINQTHEEVPFVQWWEDLLYKSDLNYDVIYEEGLTNIYKGYVTLILPAALLLSDEEKRGIKEFVADGGNLLMCWSPGCRNEKGEWVGFSFLSQLMGAVPSGSIVDPTGGTSAVLLDEGPLTAMISPGTHLDFYTYNGFVKMNLMEGRSKSDAFWFKPYWKNAPTNLRRSNSVIAHGNYMNGKYVWFGFTPEAIQEQKNNHVILQKLVLNTLKWLQNDAVVRAKVWPRGYKAGGGLLTKVKGSSTSLDRMMDINQRAGINMDLILLDEFSAQTILFDENTTNDLILTTPKKNPLSGLTLKDQTRWFGTQVEWVERISGRKPNGYFPSDWNYDEFTLPAAVRENIQFVLANPNPRHYGPVGNLVSAGAFQWLLGGKKHLSTMPKTQLTTEEWARKGLRRKSSHFNAAIREMSRIQSTGGIYLGIFDPDVIEDINAFDLPYMVASKMDSMRFWRAPTSKLIDRFSTWQNLRVSSKEMTPTRMMISLSNEGSRSIQNVEFEVYLSGKIDRVNMTSELVGSTPTNVLWLKERGICKFTIKNIGPRDNASIYLDKISEQDIAL